MRVHGIHHISIVVKDMERTIHFYGEVLGLKLVKRTVNYDDPSSKHFYFGDDDASPGTLLTFFEVPYAGQGRVGAGSTHHFALAAEDEAELVQWQERLRENGIAVTEIRDRTYFRSIYFQDPDGHIVEIATMGPGFDVDEDRDHLGEEMVYPPGMSVEATSGTIGV